MIAVSAATKITVNYTSITASSATPTLLQQSINDADYFFQVNVTGSPGGYIQTNSQIQAPNMVMRVHNGPLQVVDIPN